MNPSVAVAVAVATLGVLDAAEALTPTVVELKNDG